MLPKLSEKKFNKELEALRGIIQSAAKPFPDDKQAQKERIARAEKDMEYFGRTYFPHYISSPSSKLHKYFCTRYPEMIERAVKTGEGDKEANAAPRGNAKSTWGTFVLPLWCAVYKKRTYTLIVSETLSQSESFVQAIKAEIESNERLKQDFPAVCGEGPIWQSDTIVLRNGVKIQGVGAGQKLRGLRHGSRRPDLVVGDDLENDESVESPEQRKKLSNWFFKALMKIGAKYTVYIVVGTILHAEALLSDLLERPGWKGHKFKAVLKFSQSKLWEQWEGIFRDISVGKAEAESLADAFFDQNKVKMLAGTEVLWPEQEDYYFLMKMRTTDGPAAFDSEKQNEPLNPEDQVFLEEWFVDWEDGDVDLTGVLHAGAVDPSLGKKNKRSDPSAILGGRMKGNILYLDIADIEKRQPDRIMTDILEHHKHDPFDKLRMETVQFQEFFARQFAQLAHDKGLTINIDEYMPNTDKDLRIIRLQPWIKNGWIRFRKEMRELKKQLIYYRPKNRGGHDDGPDDLEMLLGLCESGLVQAASAASETKQEDYHAERKGRMAGGRMMGRIRGNAV
ncbi:MAG: phage terminase large subunit [Nitrospirae bacterium]|nr:phage terminase large subunit [Nitrospirota bacterium]